MHFRRVRKDIEPLDRTWSKAHKKPMSPNLNFESRHPWQSEHSWELLGFTRTLLGFTRTMLGFTRTTRGFTRTTRGFTRTTDYLVQFVFFSGMLMYCWSVIYYLSNAHSQSWYHKNLCWFVAPINESLHLVTWLIARSNTFRSKMHCNAVNFVFYVSFHRLSILDSPNTIISEHCVL